MLIAAEKLFKQYHDSPLLSEVTLYIREGEKIGVIGRNGAGKTTLLKIIARQEAPDRGGVTLHSNLQIGYLPQVPALEDTRTVLEEVLLGVRAAGKEAEAYEARHMLHTLGITDWDAQIGTLSGGQKKRVALASVLISRCELLILDEPTNHLDDGMIRWLENHLIQYKGALLMVTHDRYFLERVVSKIAEVDRGRLYLYEANYSKYLELRAQREEREAASERKRQSLLRKELAWMRQGPQGRGTKSRARIERFETLEGQPGAAPQASLSLESASTRLGKKTVELRSLSKQYGDKVILRDFDAMIARDARIGIVGPNGCGKSTLLAMIAGRIAPDRGEVIVGETVNIGYFAQECTGMDPQTRVLDYVRSFGETVQTNAGKISASQMLERFLFPPDLQWTPLSRLSGGERRRLYLLSVLMQAPNILLLDEPTNDLDIDTLMVLEDYLENFSGAVILVSHDRYFLDKTTDHIWAFGAAGTIDKHLGGYSDYFVGQQPAPAPKASKEQPRGEAPQRSKPSSLSTKPRFSFKEQREYAEIDGLIAALEKEREAVEAELSQNASDYAAVQRLMDRQASLCAQLREKEERWLYLQELAERIERYEKGEMP